MTPSNSQEPVETIDAEAQIKGTVLRPLAHAFGNLARQIDSGDYELPKTLDEAEALTEKLINEAYERLETLIAQALSQREAELNESGLEKFLRFISRNGEFEWSESMPDDTTLFRISNKALDKYGLLEAKVQDKEKQS